MCLISNIPHDEMCVFHYTVPGLGKQSSKVLEHTLMPKPLSILKKGWSDDLNCYIMNMDCLLTSVIYGRVDMVTLTHGKQQSTIHL